MHYVAVVILLAVLLKHKLLGGGTSMNFENSKRQAVPMLAPIRRKVLDNPVLHATAQQRPVDDRNLDKILLASGDRELFHVYSLFASTANVFTKLDPKKLKTVQKAELGPCRNTWKIPLPRSHPRRRLRRCHTLLS